jgi:MoaA/NifB/PqqE/SkfB family radical SAM enzyme
MKQGQEDSQLACQAPAKSMRFSHSGNVIACCYNRGHLLGSFPKESLEQIWFGKAAERLRTALQNNNFSLGCQSCEKLIAVGNRAASGAAQYDYLNNHAQRGGFPTMLDFEIDSTCNLECVMCSGEYSSSIRKNREHAPKYASPYNDEFVKQLETFIPHLSEARFVGGEPFLIPLHFKIWDRMVELNPSMVINVLTNATVLNERIKTLIDNANFKISVSIDSLVKETYERIRINANFEEVRSNFRYFKAAMDEKGHVMNFNLCPMRQNWHEIPDYFQFCSDNNIQAVLHTVEFPNHCSLWNLPPSELEKIRQSFEAVVLNGQDSVSRSNAITFKSLLEQVEDWLSSSLRSQPIAQAETFDGLTARLAIRMKEELEEGEDGAKEFHFVSALLDEFSPGDRTKIARFLLQLPAYLLVSEIRISSKERMKERFKVIAQNE